MGVRVGMGDGVKAGGAPPPVGEGLGVRSEMQATRRKQMKKALNLFMVLSRTQHHPRRAKDISNAKNKSTIWVKKEGYKINL
jgi:hypothetical protein